MEAFDPSKHLRRLHGRGGPTDYLDVKWRLVWLRSEHPDARIETALMDGGIESNYAVFRATVTVPGGGAATGWGSETKADFGDFLEKAETKSLGRALAALGYGTQFAPELDADARLVDSPRAASAPAPSHTAPTGAAAGHLERAAPPPRRPTSGSPTASPFPPPTSPGTDASGPPTAASPPTAEERPFTIETACAALTSARSLDDLDRVFNAAKRKVAASDYDALREEYKRLASDFRRERS